MGEPRATLSNDRGDKWDMPPNGGEFGQIPDSAQFNQAEVNQGKWIFYNDGFENNGAQSKVVNEGEGKVSLGFTCLSAREADYNADGICLFEHFNYCGKMQTYTESAATLTGYNSGISSAIIFQSSNWNLYTQPGFRGISSQRGPGDYRNTGELSIGNDTIESIRRA